MFQWYGNKDADFHCPKCNGGGDSFVAEDGSYTIFAECDCVKKNRKQRIRLLAGVPKTKVSYLPFSSGSHKDEILPVGA